ncbi:enoyl-CoA hydratase/isomerase family protein [Variovorax sp. M-6]|uniref:enoyl-CoA hydratase/isomerase family protein n=1 Tax=Variovorax sp. M-6 TaxID=3233041 RepID=UPI003F9AE24A
MEEAVEFAIEDSVAVITINRPQRLNALSQEVRDGLRNAWHRFENDDSLKVAILTGAGDRAFCAGMDLKEASATALRIPPRGFVPTLGDDTHVSKPTIAAVNGLALAGGWLLAQMCDLCVAADDAVFAITEAKVGRGTPWAAPLVHMLPQRICMELLLTGDSIGAHRLHELGYVNRVVPRAGLLDEARALAQRIAANAPLTVKSCRALVYQSTEMGRSAALRVGDRLFERVYLSEDAQEGPRAFAEKRAPRWRGV